MTYFFIHEKTDKIHVSHLRGTVHVWHLTTPIFRPRTPFQAFHETLIRSLLKKIDEKCKLCFISINVFFMFPLPHTDTQTDKFWKHDSNSTPIWKPKSFLLVNQNGFSHLSWGLLQNILLSSVMNTTRTVDNNLPEDNRAHNWGRAGTWTEERRRVCNEKSLN